MDNTRPNPYVGPRTFNKDERDRFYGRDREARELLSLVASEQLVIFYAQSGAGKSSLVNTSLIPDLEKKGFYILPVARVLGDAPAGLQVENIFAFNLMRSLAASDMPVESFATLKLAEFSRQLKQRADTGFEGYVLIVDQFEEIFSTHNDQWESREDFFRQLTRAMRDNPDLWVLLVMREDFIAALDPYTHLLHERGRIRYYMQRLERDAALKAIKGPVETLRPYEEDVAEKLFNDLCSIKVLGPDGKTLIDQPGQYVEPVQMQVVCYNLWEHLETGSTITAADLAKVGDVDAALGNYYAARVRGVAEAKKVSERHIREWIEKKLIASGGIRNQVLKELVTSPGGLDNDVIQALQSDLIRSEKRGASTFYELTHDRLVEPIQENNKLWFSEKLSPLQRQAALWVDKGRKDDWLSTGQALADIEAWAKQSPNDLSEVDREFLDESRAYQRQLDERQQAQARELEMSRKFAEEQARTNQRIRKALRTSTLIAGIASLFLVIAIMLGIQTFQNQRLTQMRILLNASSEALAKKDINLATLLAYQALINYGDEYGEAESGLGDIVNPIKNDPGKVPYFVGDDQTSNIKSLAVSPNGKRLAAGDANGIVTIWDLETNTELGDFSIFSEVTDIAYSPDGRTLAVVGTTSSVNLWDVSNPANAKNLLTLNDHRDRVTAIAFSPDGSLLASASWDQTVILWALDDPSTAPVVAILSGHTDVIWGVAFSPDGTLLASSSADDSVILWDVSRPNTPVTTAKLNGNGVGMGGVAFDRYGSLLASGSQDGKIILWDLATKQSVHQIEGLNYVVMDVAFSPDGSMLAARDIYGSTRLWNSADIIKGLTILDSNSNSLTFTPDNKLLLGSSNGIAVWNANLYPPEQVQVLQKSDYGNVDRVNYLSILPDGKSLFVLGLDNAPHIVNVDDPKDQPFDMSFTTSFNNIPSAVFSVNGQYVATVNDNVLTVRDMSTNTDIAQMALYDTLNAVSQDGRYIVSSSYDGYVTVREASTNKEGPRVYQGSKGYASAVAFSPDDKYIASAGGGKNILVWRVADRRVLHRIPKTDHVNYMAFSPDGTRLAVALNDSKKTIEVWDLETEQKILIIEDSELRPLNYAIAGRFNEEPQDVSQSQGEQADPVLGDVSETLSNVVGLAYTEMGLVVLHQNGVLDRWAIWPSRDKLEDYAEGKCTSCELSYSQRLDYKLYTWQMRVRDYASYFIFLLNLACYGVCVRFGYQAVFSKKQNVRQFPMWQALWRASLQGFLLIAFSFLVWVLFAYFEEFKHPDTTRYSDDLNVLLWFTLPLGLWAGGAFSHFTRGQSVKWSKTKSYVLGALAGISAGMVAGTVGVVALLFAEDGRTDFFSALKEYIFSSGSELQIVILICGGAAGLLSLLGAWFYMLWLMPWSESKTSPVVDWFRHNQRLNGWLQTWWKRGLFVFVVEVVLGVVLISIDYGYLISSSDNLMIVLIIAGIVAVFGFLFHPQWSSYIWTAVLGVVGSFVWYPIIDSLPGAVWFGVSSGFMLAAIFSYAWKRTLLVFAIGTILLIVSVYLENGTVAMDSDLPLIVLTSIALAGFGRIFYPHKISYNMILVFGGVGVFLWYPTVSSLPLALSVGLGSGFILSAILSGILHALKKI